MASSKDGSLLSWTQGEANWGRQAGRRGPAVAQCLPAMRCAVASAGSRKATVLRASALPGLGLSIGALCQ